MEQGNNIICPVCGSKCLEEEPYGLVRDSIYSGSFEACYCCNFEFGYDDGHSAFSLIHYKKYRCKWIAGKLDFVNVENQPKNWNTRKLIDQLKNIREIDYVPKQFQEDFKQYLKDIEKEIEELSKQL